MGWKLELLKPISKRMEKGLFAPVFSRKKESEKITRKDSQQAEGKTWTRVDWNSSLSRLGNYFHSFQKWNEFWSKSSGVSFKFLTFSILFCLLTLSNLGCPKQSRPQPGARCSTESVLEVLRVESVLLKSVDAFCDVTRERSHLTACSNMFNLKRRGTAFCWEMKLISINK